MKVKSDEMQMVFEKVTAKISFTGIYVDFIGAQSVERMKERAKKKILNQSAASQEPCKELNKMLKTAHWKAHLCLLGPGCFTVID